MKIVCVLVQKEERIRGAIPVPHRDVPIAVIDMEDVEAAAKFLGCDIPQDQFYVGGCYTGQRPFEAVDVKFSYKKLKKDKRWKQVEYTKNRLPFLFSLGDISILFKGNKRTLYQYRLSRVAFFP